MGPKLDLNQRPIRTRERSTKINFNQYQTVEEKLKESTVNQHMETSSDGMLSNRGGKLSLLPAPHQKKLSIASKHRRVTSLDMKSISDHIQS
jgi:hypothetical protein